MKKQISILLLIVLLFNLTGCSFHSEDINNSVEFYYPWADLESAIKQDPSCTAIESEPRDISGHAGDLKYLLPLYLRGPLDPELKSPFPAGCSLMYATVSDDALCITLDSSFAALENTQLTIACACLARTGFSLTDVTQVQIRAEASDGAKSVDITISADSLLLTDTDTQAPTEES